MTFRNLFLLLAFLAAWSKGFGQHDFEKLSTRSKKAEKFYLQASGQYDRKNLQGALESLRKAVLEDPEFFEAYMLTGQISGDLSEKTQALRAFRKAVQIRPDGFPRAYLIMANIELSDGNYQEARQDLAKYLSYKDLLPASRLKAEYSLKACDFALNAIAHPVPFEPKNLGDSVNSEWDDYVNAVTADDQTLLLTRKRPADEFSEVGGKRFEEDFYITKRVAGEWSRTVNLGPPVNTHGNEGTICFSPDGMMLFFAGCQRPDGYGSCDLYMSKREGNHWTVPENLGDVVNSGLWDSQPSFSSDGKTLYYSRAKSGGKGTSDLWSATLQENGQWSIPVNLGDSVNTAGNEMAPFIHPDGKTLYFTSDGWMGMGGMDFFFTRKKPDGTWSTPVNLGYPINSYADEINIIVNGKGDYAYMSSDKLGGKGKMDIYTFQLYAQARPEEVTYVRGKVFDALNHNKLQVKFQLIDLETAKLVVESYSDPVTGEFLVCLPTDRNYALNVSREGYLFYSENFALKGLNSQVAPFLKDVPLKPIRAGETVVLNNIFFETAKYDLKDESKIELEKLADLLKRNPSMKIEIQGHTDNVGDDKYNLDLSLNRARSVFNYLVTSGIPQERLSYKGYGETRPVAGNDTEEGRARNRRTEFTVLSN